MSSVLKPKRADVTSQFRFPKEHVIEEWRAHAAGVLVCFRHSLSEREAAHQAAADRKEESALGNIQVAHTNHMSLAGHDLMCRSSWASGSYSCCVTLTCGTFQCREVEGIFMFATSRDASDTEEILAFLNEAVAASCEGLMVRSFLLHP